MGSTALDQFWRMFKPPPWFLRSNVLHASVRLQNSTTVGVAFKSESTWAANNTMILLFLQSDMTENCKVAYKSSYLSADYIPLLNDPLEYWSLGRCICYLRVSYVIAGIGYLLTIVHVQHISLARHTPQSQGKTYINAAPTRKLWMCGYQIYKLTRLSI